MDFRLGAGGIVLTGEQTSIEPIARLAVEQALVEGDKVPILRASLELSALNGDTVDIGNVETFKNVETSLRIIQPIKESWYIKPYAEFGFSTKLPGTSDPLKQTARYWSIGLELGDIVEFLTVGFGTNQLLDGKWQPVLTIVAKKVLFTQDKINTSLVGRALLDMNLYHSDRRDVVMVGIMVDR